MWGGARKAAEAMGIPASAIARDNPWEYMGGNLPASVLLGAAATMATGGIGAVAPMALFRGTRFAGTSARAIQLLRSAKPVAQLTPAGAFAKLGEHVARNPVIAGRMAAGALPGALALGPAGIPIGAAAGQLLRGKAVEGAGRFVAEKTPEILKNAIIGYGARVGGISADAMASTVVNSAWDADWNDLPGAAEYVLDTTGKSALFAGGLTTAITGGIAAIPLGVRTSIGVAEKSFQMATQSPLTKKIQQWVWDMRAKQSGDIPEDVHRYVRQRGLTDGGALDRENLLKWERETIPNLEKAAVELVTDAISSKGSIRRWDQMGFDESWLEGRVAELTRQGEGVPNATEAATQSLEFIDRLKIEIEKLAGVGQESLKTDPLTGRSITEPISSLSPAQLAEKAEAEAAGLPWRGPESPDFAETTLPPGVNDLNYLDGWRDQLDKLEQRILAKVEREAHDFIAGGASHKDYQKLSRDAHREYVLGQGAGKNPSGLGTGIGGRVNEIADQARASGDYFPTSDRVRLRFEKFTPDFLQANGRPAPQAGGAIPPAFVVSEGSQGNFVRGVDVDATHTIFIDQDLISEGYLNAAWKNPTVKGVDPLTRYFGGENEWMTWLVEHELAHIRKPKDAFFEAVAEESANWGGQQGGSAGLSNITGRQIKRAYGDADYENYINDLANAVPRAGRPRIDLQKLYANRKGKAPTFREQALMDRLLRSDGDVKIMLGHIKELMPDLLDSSGQGAGTVVDMFSRFEKFAASIQGVTKDDLLSKSLLGSDIPEAMKKSTGEFLSGTSPTRGFADADAPKRAWGGLSLEKSKINTEFRIRDDQQKLVEANWAKPDPKDPGRKVANEEEIKIWSHIYGDDSNHQHAEGLLEYAKQNRKVLELMLDDTHAEGFYFGQSAVNKLNEQQGTNYTIAQAKIRAMEDLKKLTELEEQLLKAKEVFNSNEVKDARLFKKAMAAEQHAGEVFGGGGGLQGGTAVTSALTALGTGAGFFYGGPAGGAIGAAGGMAAASALGYVSDVVMAPMRSLNRARTIEILAGESKRHLNMYIDEFFSEYATNAPTWYTGSGRFPRGLVSAGIADAEFFRMDQEKEAGIKPEKGASPGRKGVGRGRKGGRRGPKERDDGGAKSFEQLKSKDVDNAKKILGRLVETPGELEKFANALVDKSYDDASSDMARDLRDGLMGAAYRLYTALPKKQRADILFEDETPYTDDQIQKFATALNIEENGYRAILEMLIRGTLTREAVNHLDQSHPQQSADMKQAFAMYLEDPELRDKIPESMRAPIRVFMDMNMDTNMIARAQQTWAPPEEGGGQQGGPQRKGTAKKMNLPVGGTMQSIVERGMTGSMAGTAVA
jgi:hypothetical protein